MSEFINNSRTRVNQLKELILGLHTGKTADETKEKLVEMMGNAPYSEVVQAEEELIEEGLDREEVLKLCDLHTDALGSSIDKSMAKIIPKGHPLDILSKENEALQKQVDKIKHFQFAVENGTKSQSDKKVIIGIHTLFNELMDIEKHYLKLENLLFPFLEKYQITGPPMVMWGKHDETRAFLKSSIQLLTENNNATNEELSGFFELIFIPTLKAVSDMVYKEEQILFPMAMDTLTEIDWYEILQQSEDIGYCLYYPEIIWKPELSNYDLNDVKYNDKVKLSTGSFSPEELEGFLNSLPVDFTFVDKNDKVKYFSEGRNRVFPRSKAIIGRLVQYCHPPSSVHIVDQILSDFKSGSQEQAKFWIQMGDKFVHIAYFAVKDKNGDYLGTVEMSHDVAEYRRLEGERRILNYED
ncbi:MAG: hemerythrin [Ignavibacteriales bacterium CG18_big_fil_WC_8_21_14_2_50_31_20]|nr:MAG: hemerythrin [Ignavibacteriales bacterium CG18_big_fil_WC_8_21_14_2_50_31_20]